MGGWTGGESWEAGALVGEGGEMDLKGFLEGEKIERGLCLTLSCHVGRLRGAIPGDRKAIYASDRNGVKWETR